MQILALLGTDPSKRNNQLSLRALSWLLVSESARIQSQNTRSFPLENPGAKPGAPVRPGVPPIVQHLSTWVLDLYPVVYRVLEYTAASSLRSCRILNKKFHQIGESLTPKKLRQSMLGAQFILIEPARYKEARTDAVILDQEDPEMECNGTAIDTSVRIPSFTTASARIDSNYPARVEPRTTDKSTGWRWRT